MLGTWEVGKGRVRVRGDGERGLRSLLGTWEVGKGRGSVRGDSERGSRSLLGTWEVGNRRGRVPPCEAQREGGDGAHPPL